MIKKLSALVMSVIIATGLFAGCDRSDIVKDSSTTNFGGAYANFVEPDENEEIAVIKIKDYGTVKVQLFPEFAPQGVKNFKGLVEQGYYNGLTFHRIINDFCIQGGDPEGTGMGGSSIWGEEFPIEPSDKLFHFKGALAYARPATGGNSSQFYFAMGAAGNPVDDETFNALSAQGVEYPVEVRAKYMEVGGPFFLDGQYTVFGQVFEGLELLDEIQKVPTDQMDMPSTPVIIESITIENYSAN